MTGQKEPAGQVVALLDPLRQYDPTGHGTQVEDPLTGAMEPAGHEEQILETATDVCPVGHGKQLPAELPE